ncbi:MAG: CPBP family intramembrane glutamic endopeptidase [Nocardioides sp.]
MSRGRLTRARQAARGLAGRLPMSITHVVPVRHDESAAVVAHRRHVVAGVSVMGASLLGASLSTKPDSRAFYGLTLATAATWTLGGAASGPLHLGWIQSRDRRIRRPVVTPVATGVGAFAFFYGCGLVARRIPVLDEAISKVLVFAEEGHSPLVLLTTAANGLGEEVFFRGALYAALPPEHRVAASTVIYTLTTVATRNPSLVLAAGFMGSLFGLQRRATGGLQAPALTHLTWSTLMVRYLPPLFRQGRARIADRPGREGGTRR